MDSYFQKSLETNKNINYIELIIKENDCENLDINWNKNNFGKLLKYLIQKNYTYFKKEYDVYKYHNLEYQIYSKNEKPIVYESNLLDHFSEKKLIYHGFVRNSIPIHMFPSTMNINDKYSVTRITIKINNRVYLNFETQNKSDIDYYNIYLNYNHSNNVDINNNIEKIKNLLQIISAI
jgi:hypothetical protein